MLTKHIQKLISTTPPKAFKSIRITQESHLLPLIPFPNGGVGAVKWWYAQPPHQQLQKTAALIATKEQTCFNPPLLHLPLTIESIMTRPLVVDIHTHVYPPSYMAMLRARKEVPYVHDPENATPRLIILSSDDNPAIPLHKRGRPVDASYSDINVKLAFMRQHGIDSSVISLANPWLDFMHGKEASTWAQRINDDLESTCASVNKVGDPNEVLALEDKQSLFAFGVLPTRAPYADIVSEINRLKDLLHMRGVIMGTTGLGNGLDDPAMDPVWNALQETQQLIFLHPHYGLPDEAFGGAEKSHQYGHVLPLALGFPLETTIAVTRMLLSGVFDRFPRLQVLLAHSGGTIPFLAGRIESCILHERNFVANGGTVPGPQRSIWDVLKTNIYLDSVVYGAAGLQAAIKAEGSVDRLLFGTDHPFFPPLSKPEEQWPSVMTNYKAIDEVCGEQAVTAAKILGGNAARILKLR